MSKPVKALLRKELIRRMEGVGACGGLAVLSLSGVDGLAANRLRRRLRDGDIRLTVVKNSVARQALKEVGLTSACQLIEGPCALAWGGKSVVAVVRELLETGKDIPAISVKGALMEGEVFASDRIEQLSKYPTREEALGTVVMLARSAGARLAGCLLGPGGRLAGTLKTIGQQNEN